MQPINILPMRILSHVTLQDTTFSNQKESRAKRKRSSSLSVSGMERVKESEEYKQIESRICDVLGTEVIDKLHAE